MKQINKKIIKTFFPALVKGNFDEWSMWVKDIIKMRTNGYDGELDDYDAILYYEEMVGNDPVVTNNQGKIIYTYVDGLSVIMPTYTLESVFPNKEVEEKVMKYINKSDK